MSDLEVRDWPCTRCPWRTDTDLCTFSIADMRKLAQASGHPGADAPRTAPAMSCHKDQPDTAHAMRLCAGWLASVGRYHLGVRLAEMAGWIPGSALRPGVGWPQLHASFTAMIDSWPEDPQSNPAEQSASPS